MRLLYLAWRFSGASPYALFHGLDEDYVPWGGGEPERPAFPERLRQVIYGFGLMAHEDAIRLAGGKIPRERKPRSRDDKRQD